MASGSCSSSNIWNFFDRIEINLENNKKEIKAKCKICKNFLVVAQMQVQVIKKGIMKIVKLKIM